MKTMLQVSDIYMYCKAPLNPGREGREVFFFLFKVYYSLRGWNFTESDFIQNLIYTRGFTGQGVQKSKKY